MVQSISVAQFYLSFIYANVTLSHYGLHMHPPSEKYLAFKTSSVSLDITFCFLVDVPSSFHSSSWEGDWKKPPFLNDFKWKESSPVLIAILCFYNTIL